MQLRYNGNNAPIVPAEMVFGVVPDDAPLRGGYVALTVLFGFLCVAHVQNFFNQRSTDCNCWSEYHLYFGGICVVYYLCEKEGNPQCGKYYLHDYICFMVVTDCRVWRICTIFDFCKMSCFAMPINFIKFNFVK